MDSPFSGEPSLTCCLDPGSRYTGLRVRPWQIAVLGAIIAIGSTLGDVYQRTSVDARVQDFDAQISDLHQQENGYIRERDQARQEMSLRNLEDSMLAILLVPTPFQSPQIIHGQLLSWAGDLNATFSGANTFTNDKVARRSLQDQETKAFTRASSPDVNTQFRARFDLQNLTNKALFAEYNTFDSDVAFIDSVIAQRQQMRTSAERRARRLNVILVSLQIAGIGVILLKDLADHEK